MWEFLKRIFGKKKSGKKFYINLFMKDNSCADQYEGIEEDAYEIAMEQLMFSDYDFVTIKYYSYGDRVAIVKKADIRDGNTGEMKEESVESE